ncbi:flagellar basal body protein [Benzoatithermus flavus]|uniref:Flagellar basal body protein n=1 Tax=Benzoatithermus flavus TaxID=3108223 RepID=A0ABU8XYC6_9PROT
MQPRVLLFELMSGRSRWLAERQAVLSRNVANADTPGFRPRDLEPAGFADLLGRKAGGLEPVRTSPVHLAPAPPERGAFRTVDAGGAEASPSGNAVALPEQMQKMAATELDHQLTTHLYRRYMALLRTALGALQS